MWQVIVYEEFPQNSVSEDFTIRWCAAGIMQPVRADVTSKPQHCFTPSLPSLRLPRIFNSTCKGSTCWHMHTRTHTPYSQTSAVL